MIKKIVATVVYIYILLNKLHAVYKAKRQQRACIQER